MMKKNLSKLAARLRELKAAVAELQAKIMRDPRTKNIAGFAALAVLAAVAFSLAEPSEGGEKGYLRAATSMPAVIAGKVSGTVTLAAGTQVGVVRRDGDQALISCRAGEKWIPSGDISAEPLTPEELNAAKSAMAAAATAKPAAPAEGETAGAAPAPSPKNPVRWLEKLEPVPEGEMGALLAIPAQDNGRWLKNREKLEPSLEIERGILRAAIPVMDNGEAGYTVLTPGTHVLAIRREGGQTLISSREGQCWVPSRDISYRLLSCNEYGAAVAKAKAAGLLDRRGRVIVKTAEADPNKPLGRWSKVEAPDATPELERAISSTKYLVADEATYSGEIRADTVFKEFLAAGGIIPDEPMIGAEFSLRPELEKWGVSVKGSKELQARQPDLMNCAILSFQTALELLWSREEGRPVKLSAAFLRWAHNKHAYDPNNGADHGKIAKGIQKYGVCEESLMPESCRTPSAEALRDAEKRKRLVIRKISVNVKIGSGQPHAELIMALFDSELRKGHPVIVSGASLFPKNLSDPVVLTRRGGPDDPDGKKHYGSAFGCERGWKRNVRDGGIPHAFLLVGYKVIPENWAQNLVIPMNLAPEEYKKYPSVNPAVLLLSRDSSGKGLGEKGHLTYIADELNAFTESYNSLGLE